MWINLICLLLDVPWILFTLLKIFLIGVSGPIDSHNSTWHLILFSLIKLLALYCAWFRRIKLYLSGFLLYLLKAFFLFLTAWLTSLFHHGTTRRWGLSDALGTILLATSNILFLNSLNASNGLSWDMVIFALFLWYSCQLALSSKKRSVGVNCLLFHWWNIKWIGRWSLLPGSS